MSVATGLHASAFGGNPLFAQLSQAELEDIAAQMRPRQFDERAVICRAGEPGESLFVITDGLAHVTLAVPEPGGSRIVAKLRRGDIVGEMSLVSGEPRSATVVAVTRTEALELDRSAFADVIAQHPTVLANLTRILTRRLAETTARVGTIRPRGEAVAFVVGQTAAALVPDVLDATRAASPHSIGSLDARDSIVATLDVLDDALAEHGAVVLVVGSETEDLPLLLRQADRAVALVGEVEARELAAAVAGLDQLVELVLLGSGAGGRPASPASESMPLKRVIGRDEAAPHGVSPAEIAWLGRHLSRTKLGLALGAGGAKGYALIGALSVLEQAGYTVDYVAGSSIGAVVGTWLALGQSAGQVEKTMRDTFSRDVVADMFKVSMAGMSSGLETMTRVFRQTTSDCTFDDLLLPFVAMTVDLNRREPAPLTEGPLWQALLAATALAGFFPPFERDGQRLVDGLALVPVPTEAVLEAGADIAVSVNLIGRETLPAWPGGAPPEEAPAGPRARMLDALLEVMDLAQLDSSVRHAELADVTITPLFGPCSWRDFHLGDLFFEAGRKAAEEQLPSLRELAQPQLVSLPT